MTAAPGVRGFIGAALSLVVLGIAIVDARRFLIPDGLNASALVLGLTHAAILGAHDVLDALAAASLRALALALMFLAVRALYQRLRGRQGIGLGDVKLAAVAGSWLDWSILPVAIEIAALSALLACAVRYWVLRRPFRITTRLPFGLFFAPAIWIGWLLAETVLAT